MTNSTQPRTFTTTHTTRRRILGIWFSKTVTIEHPMPEESRLMAWTDAALKAIPHKGQRICRDALEY